MRRREIVALIGGAATAWPLAVRAQPSRTWRVGFLHPGQSATVALRLVAFREGLGTPEGGGAADVEIIERVASNRIDQLPAMAAELVKAGVHAICAVSPPAMRAAKDATGAVPIVAMDLESDPVANGWAASLGRPGGNVTGVFLDLPDFTAKCVQLLREAVPGMSKLALLWHPASGPLQLEAARKAAAAFALTGEVFEVSQTVEFEPTFRAMGDARAGGVLMLSSPLFGGNPQGMAELARKNRLPAINQFPDFAEQGGLLAYGPELQGMFRQAGAMTRRILQGTPAAQLPIDRPVRFRLVANLKTATALGLDLPPSLIARADEVIE